ncbi:MAG TPA: serine/threonine-protein kinase [Polyangia bacterium]|nr:serine/threonine-protein kinase [Polyangia bacterium]
MVGERIGNYQVVQRLGEGGMAAVYLATHPTLGRRVAVKVLNRDLARVEQMVQRFFDEARAASAIGHRGIVEVFDLGTLPSGAPYIVMDYLDGESLAQRVARTGRLSLEAALEIAAQVASVMAAAHGRGIVHRDLKPDNLFLVPDPLLPGRELVKLLDFGIAKLVQRPTNGGDQRTRTGVILGTPRYMSPEQCRESRDVDHRTDVYSLGVVLYEMLAGAPPFASASWGELAHMHIGVTPPALQAIVPDVPPAVAAVVHRMLEKDPAARFQSMLDVGAALEATSARRTALWPGSATPHPVSDEQTDAPPRGRALGAGATRRLNEPAPPPARAQRRTTLTGAASEILRNSELRRRAIRVAPVLVVASVAAAVAIFGAVASRRAPAPAALGPSPPPALAAPVTPPALPATPPPPPAIEPPVDHASDRNPNAPSPAAEATPPIDPIAIRPPARPARRKRRSPVPAKPAAPVDRRPYEPEKI